MGLFGNNLNDLRSRLEAMQLSTLTDIDLLSKGEQPPPRGFGEESEVVKRMRLDSRITQYAEDVRTLSSKGKKAKVDALLSEFEERPVPQTIMFRAEPGQSFGDASTAAATSLGEAGEDPEQAQNDARWRLVIAEIRKRSS